MKGPDMIRVMLTAVALAASGAALAKIPAPELDEAAKAKAAEAAAKTAWQGKVDAFQLCKAQDRVAAVYRKTAAAKPASATAATTPGAPASAPAAAKPVATPATASQGGGTPVAAVAPVAATPAGCADPGPFAYAPPAQKPLETAGAHSPAANATSPPSVRPNSAEMAPSKPGVATKP
jgi:hypothetical protein